SADLGPASGIKAAIRCRHVRPQRLHVIAPPPGTWRPSVAPACTQDETDRRLAICKACPLFNGRLCTHESCRCNINSDLEFLHKLAWAAQRCPLRQWRL